MHAIAEAITQAPLTFARVHLLLSHLVQQSRPRVTWPLLGLLMFAAALLGPAPPSLADFKQQGGKLIGTGGGGNQGQSVALSADGNTALVGSRSGMWVFTRSGGAWTQQFDKLVGEGGSGTAQQGFSVALSADGNTAIMGGPFDDNNEGGAAWVFTNRGGVWRQQGGKLVGSGAVGVGGSEQGFSVALSADGNTAIIGGPLDTNGRGAVWVFTRTDGVWSQQGKLVGGDATGVGAVYMGRSVALSADGNTAIFGGTADNKNFGAAWVFTRSGGVWSQQGPKLVGTGAPREPGQGASVALSADGNTAIVGGVTDDYYLGAVWVFTRSGGVWRQQGNKLVDAENQRQGDSVALSADGNAALVGGVRGASVFTRSGGAWTKQGNTLVSTGAIGDQSVALTCNTAVVGTPFDNRGDGAAWVFVASPSLARTATHDLNGDCLSDIVWRNGTSGQVDTWLLNGTSVIGAGSPDSVYSDWSIVGQRDFNGDGFSDILWRNTGGLLEVWLMNGNSVIGGGSPGSPSTEWTIAGTGDFNNDGKGDILWRYTGTGPYNGVVLLWFLDGATVIGGGLSGSAASVWTVAGTADFNRDGFTDVLWRNTSTGEVDIWLLNGVTIIGGGGLGEADADWAIAGTGDFDGDGHSDILWRNSRTGQVVIWLVDGARVIGAGLAGAVTTDWAIAQTGDYNGDGKSDILWRNTTTGQVLIWFMNGLTIGSGGSLGDVTTDWQIQGMNAD
jgi:hypothetical protein